ncbi:MULTISPECIES: very short patch repair endonuclease [unclassified Mesorhizobium]|uniref:very short patch repair endonuclease n=2 Tax=unclassified Mesorhizobium TaxID=325217 RepID=UPI00296224C9|nr:MULTISPECIES: very short patch repair endonuclease [unclassified Mesorhizobium]
MMTSRSEAMDAGVSARMRKQRVADTQAETLVRTALFAVGIRYRKHWPVPGRRRRTIDIAMPGRKLAIFIDGCFWHGCEVHKTVPRSNEAWWRAKLDENRRRDHETTELLVGQGWKVLRFWEHDRSSEVVAAVIRSISEMDAYNG